MKYPAGSAKLMIYFHANAEDLGRAHKFLNYVHSYLRMHVLAVEYPGYGVYCESNKLSSGSVRNASAENILKDAGCVYKFV